MKKTLSIICIVVLVVVFGVVWMLSTKEASKPSVTNFEECVTAGNPVMESYPRQCNAGGQTFVEKIDTTSSEPVACTMEAKLCPDGSYVGRTGPNCEFATCPAVNSLLSESEARIIAEKSCIKGGESLARWSYNENSKTWWYDANLNATKPGCNPACVVSETTKTAEINWRCTGLILDSGVTGQVTLGPTCPVIQNQPDPECADRPYETTIQVIQVGSPQSAPFTTVKTDSQGTYSVTLPPGDYALQPVGGNVLPRCETKDVTVVSSKITQVNLSCDTGIR